MSAHCWCQVGLYVHAVSGRAGRRHPPLRRRRPDRQSRALLCVLRWQAVVVLVDHLGLSAGGFPIPGARVVPRGAEGLDVRGWVWLQAFKYVAGEAGGPGDTVCVAAAPAQPAPGAGSGRRSATHYGRTTPMPCRACLIRQR